MKNKEEKVQKIYKEPNKCETETTVNVLYSENILSIYTNKVDLQKSLNKILGNATKEYIKGNCQNNDYVEKYKSLGDNTNFFFKKTIYMVKKNG